MAVAYRDIVSALRPLGLDRIPVIVHASLSAFGEIRGGAETLLGALLSSTGGVCMPTFTYKTMITPEDGPAGNGITYGSGHDLNRMAEFYRPEMPADRLMGQTAEALRRHPQALRSMHPILSFSGVGVDAACQAQTLADPLAPIGVLAEHGAWVLLLGVDHSVNTSIHYAEKLAGRRQFTRWALTTSSILECPGFPGCSNGFTRAEPLLKGISQHLSIGPAHVTAVPLHPMLIVLAELLREDPLALLCDSPDCERCAAAREN